MRNAGWADHTSLAGELRAWARLATQVNVYPATVDDYTNDLCSRDYLAAVAGHASIGLRAAITEELSAQDELFRENTVPDSDGRLGRFFRVDRKGGWWWRRRPASGPLAAYFAQND